MTNAHRVKEINIDHLIQFPSNVGQCRTSVYEYVENGERKHDLLSALVTRVTDYNVSLAYHVSKIKTIMDHYDIHAFLGPRVSLIEISTHGSILVTYVAFKGFHVLDNKDLVGFGDVKDSVSK